MVKELAWSIADDRFLRRHCRRSGMGPLDDDVLMAYHRRSEAILHRHVPHLETGYTWSSTTPRWRIVWSNLKVSVIGQVPAVVAAWSYSGRYMTKLTD